MNQKSLKILTEDRWFDQFRPIRNKIVSTELFDGCMFETYGEELEEVQRNDLRRVWTLLEEDGQRIITPGLHFINRLGYFITEVPWENANTEVRLK